MEPDPESNSVNITFFPQIQISKLLRTDQGTLRKICGLKSLYKTIYQGVQENIVILNVTIFCVETRLFGNIKFCCLIITPFVS